MTFDDKMQLLRSIVDEDNRVPCDRLYRCTVQDQDYIFGTDGHHLLAFAVTSIQADSVAVMLDQPKRLEAIEQWLSNASGVHAGSLDFARLHQWLKARAFVQCPACGGNGHRPLIIPYDMNGEMVDPFNEIDIRTIADIPMDRNRLVSVLAYLPSESGSVELYTQVDPAKDKHYSPILFAADDWKYIVMPCRVDDPLAEAARAESFELFDCETVTQ